MKKLIILLFILYPVYGNNLSEQVSLNQNDWKILQYKSIKPNDIIFKDKKLTIKVDGSASPLIYPLSSPRKLNSIDIDIEMNGELTLKDIKQGDPKNDDFKFRIGVVYAGDKTLNGFQRLIAPKWINTLYSLAPKDKGVDYIHFFNSWQDSKIKGQSRVHYQSDLLKESFILNNNKNKIKQTIPLDPNKEVVALWISSDGDDTGSKFSVLINKITLTGI